MNNAPQKPHRLVLSLRGGRIENKFSTLPDELQVIVVDWDCQSETPDPQRNRFEADGQTVRVDRLSPLPWEFIAGEPQLVEALRAYQRQWEVPLL